MTSLEGVILNKPTELKRNSAIVKAGIVVPIGLCYIDGANGVKSAPTDNSKDADELFWIENAVGSATETKDKKVTIYAVDGLQVIGKSDGVIAVNSECKASDTAPDPALHNGLFITHSIRVDSVANHNTDNKLFVANYRGHEDEVKEGKTLTSSADEDLGVFDLRGGN